jgi:hypothetical protein
MTGVTSMVSRPFCDVLIERGVAEVAELADAPGSGLFGENPREIQVLPRLSLNDIGLRHFP